MVNITPPKIKNFLIELEEQFEQPSLVQQIQAPLMHCGEDYLLADEIYSKLSNEIH